MTLDEAKKFADWLTSRVFTCVIWGAFLWVALLITIDVSPILRDSTDAKDGPRSSMQLRIDHGTGCQYLETKGGSITPRLSWSGAQIGCRESDHVEQ